MVNASGTSSGDTMKKITMFVEITLDVPDEVDIQCIHLDNSLEDFKVQEFGKPIDGVEITGYTTVKVIDDDLPSFEGFDTKGPIHL